MALDKADVAALTQLIAAGVTEAMKPLTARLSAGPAGPDAGVATAPPPPDRPPAAMPAGLTADDLTRALDAREQQRARGAFDRDRLADLPAVYRQQLGTDPAKFADDERRIRQAYADDLTAKGYPPPAGTGGGSGGGGGGGAQPPQAFDYSRLTSSELILLGVRSSEAGRTNNYGLAG